MHLAKCVGCRSVVAYSSSEPTDLYGYTCNKLVFSKTPCYSCINGEKILGLDKCNKKYKCIKNVDLKELILAVKEMMQENTIFPPKIEQLTANKANGLEYYKKWLKRPPQVTGFTKNIFSITNNYDRSIKIITIFGFKFYLKK